ncbi:MAG: carboxypeptidase-like regulatory domain-containing protein, partial [Acidobacteria bacterium]|nr:carboxypeptidase-like regulatory domain-containing protein [Acidobacteriota bacterium]
MSNRKILLGFASLTLLFSQNLWSQALSGTIVGTVTDQASAVVPRAKVSLVNEGTKFTRTVETNASGQYVAYSIPTGNYTITAESEGFQKLVRSGVQLTAADTLTVDLQLAVGSVQQTMEVTASAPLLQAQTATVSNLVNNEQILQMPLNGRTFTSLLLLAPGAHGGSSGNLGSGIYAMRADANISVNGSIAQNNSY